MPSHWFFHCSTIVVLPGQNFPLPQKMLLSGNIKRMARIVLGVDTRTPVKSVKLDHYQKQEETSKVQTNLSGTEWGSP